MLAVEKGLVKKAPHITRPSNHFLHIGLVCRGDAEAEAEIGATGSPRVFSGKTVFHPCGAWVHPIAYVRNRIAHRALRRIRCVFERPGCSCILAAALCHPLLTSGADEVQNPTFMRQSDRER